MLFVVNIKNLKTLKYHTFSKEDEKNMPEENISEEFRLTAIDKTRNYFIEKTKENELITKKHEKVCKILSYAEHLCILASEVTGCVSVNNMLKEYNDTKEERNKKILMIKSLNSLQQF